MDQLIARDDGSLEMHLSEREARAVRQVALDIIARLDEEPADDVRRLFPPAYPDDARQQDEFASLTRNELLEAKRSAARSVAGTIEAGKAGKGGRTCLLDLETVRSWVTVLNDARLILGTLLDVTEEMDHEPLPPDHPDAPPFNMYLYLGGMQEMLVHHLLEHDLDA